MASVSLILLKPGKIDTRTRPPVQVHDAERFALHNGCKDRSPLETMKTCETFK